MRQVTTSIGPSYTCGYCLTDGHQHNSAIGYPRILPVFDLNPDLLNAMLPPYAGAGRQYLFRIALLHRDSRTHCRSPLSIQDICQRTNFRRTHIFPPDEHCSQPVPALRQQIDSKPILFRKGRNHTTRNQGRPHSCKHTSEHGVIGT